MDFVQFYDLELHFLICVIKNLFLLKALKAYQENYLRRGHEKAHRHFIWIVFNGQYYLRPADGCQNV